MIFSNLTRHCRARRRQYSLLSWLLCWGRSARVLLHYRAHRELCRLDLVRHHLAHPGNDDLFHHLSHRGYLARGLSARQRVQAVLAHYRFEQAHFDQAYQQAIYRDSGLVLWQQASGEHRFLIRLELASRANAEGDLTLALVADGKVLHRLSFSWVDGALLGLDAPTVPFIARNQGRWTDSGEAFAAFEDAFPNNSPSFFCFAALQGVVQAAGMAQVAAVACIRHLAYDPADAAHFANAYDGFWRILGGTLQPNGHWLIALPFYVKPLADMPSKHRKRAAQRREYWRQIGAAARAAVGAHLLPAPAAAAPATAARATAEA